MGVEIRHPAVGPDGAGEADPALVAAELGVAPVRVVAVVAAIAAGAAIVAQLERAVDAHPVAARPLHVADVDADAAIAAGIAALRFVRADVGGVAVAAAIAVALAVARVVTRAVARIVIAAAAHLGDGAGNARDAVDHFLDDVAVAVVAIIVSLRRSGRGGGEHHRGGGAGGEPDQSLHVILLCFPTEAASLPRPESELWWLQRLSWRP